MVKKGWNRYEWKRIADADFDLIALKYAERHEICNIYSHHRSNVGEDEYKGKEGFCYQKFLDSVLRFNCIIQN